MEVLHYPQKLKFPSWLTAQQCAWQLSWSATLVTLTFLSIFAFPILSETELQNNYLSTLSALQNTADSGINFTSSKLTKHWLAQLSENPVEGICGHVLFTKQDNFLSTVFSNNFLRLKQTLWIVATQRNLFEPLKFDQ